MRLVEPVSERNNFLHLIVSLVVLLLVGALVDEFPHALGHHIFQAVTVIALAAAIVGLRSSRLKLNTGIGFTVCTLIIVVLGVFLDLVGLSYLHLLFTGQIDHNKIVGAICIYLLIGLIWALMYLFIAQSVPGAFNGMEQVVWYENFADGAYYSFVTLTTLGYGDISPVAPVARFLVYMEAIVGVFYMAILVASLIGMRVSALHSDHE